MSIQERVKATVRDVPDFPKPGILFKDITPILENPVLCREITIALTEAYRNTEIDAVVGVESRGFLFGMLIAQQLNVPFIPVRKAGKLPFNTIQHSYSLEYGTATVEMHVGSLKPEWNVLVHDDLLATGGTAMAAAELIQQQQAHVAGFSFLIELDFLKGRDSLLRYAPIVDSLINY
jgi:adenine phosphoribosyltransferase